MVVLGDYVDRGPDSPGVFAFLIRRQQAQPGTVICLTGNPIFGSTVYSCIGWGDSVPSKS